MAMQDPSYFEKIFTICALKVPVSYIDSCPGRLGWGKGTQKWLWVRWNIEIGNAWPWLSSAPSKLFNWRRILCITILQSAISGYLGTNPIHLSGIDAASIQTHRKCFPLTCNGSITNIPLPWGGLSYFPHPMYQTPLWHSCISVIKLDEIGSLKRQVSPDNKLMGRKLQSKVMESIPPFVLASMPLTSSQVHSGVLQQHWHLLSRWFVLGLYSFFLLISTICFHNGIPFHLTVAPR